MTTKAKHRICRTLAPWRDEFQGTERQIGYPVTRARAIWRPSDAHNHNTRQTRLELTVASDQPIVKGCGVEAPQELVLGLLKRWYSYMIWIGNSFAH